MLALTSACCCAQVREGLYYNPYFTGGAIAMPKMLADGGTEYDDGTIATESQQAKVRSEEQSAIMVMHYASFSTATARLLITVQCASACLLVEL